MVKNPGKAFEEDWKKSVPKECWYYRFRDSSGAWGNGDNTRFTPSNACDCMIMTNDKLYLFELKTHKGSSIPFSAIRATQLKELSNIKHEKIIAYFVFNFRETDNTYCVQATKVKDYIETANRKSITLSWINENGIKIEQQKKKVTWRYNLGEVLGLG